MLEADHISKRFGGVAALDDVTIRFAPGRIHAVLGENGAGKSTLMRILYGMLRPDSGTVSLGGRRLQLRRPADAQAARIGMVHQHFMLVERLTVVENVLLGHRERGFWLSLPRARQMVRDAAERFGLEVDPDREVESLSVGQRQRVEILKALLHDAQVLILDEPTAVLTPGESEQFFVALRRLRDAGRTVIFISHKLAEVVAISDDVTVLRGGRLICSEPMCGLQPADLAERMVGQRVAKWAPARGRAPGEPVLQLDAVTTAGGGVRLVDVDLRVGRGEIVGVAGVDGNGQAELTRVVLGLDAPVSGRVVCGAHARGAAVAHVADDRHREALVLDMTLAENAVLKGHATPRFARAGWLRREAIDSHARQLIAEYDVRPPWPGARAASLSGGNQQKLVVARELESGPELIVAVNPTRGLDVAATDFVHQRLVERRGRGAGVLLISADLDEILRLADRVCVLCGGRLTPAPTLNAVDGQRPAHDVTAIARLMAGLAVVAEDRA